MILGILSPNSLITNLGVACETNSRGLCVLVCILVRHLCSWLLVCMPLCGTVPLCGMKVLVPLFRLMQTPLCLMCPMTLAISLLTWLPNRLIIPVCLVLCMCRMTIRPVVRVVTCLNLVPLIRLLRNLLILVLVPMLIVLTRWTRWLGDLTIMLLVIIL